MKKPTDPMLGMDRLITRKDLLHGVGALTAGALTVGPLSSASALAGQIPVTRRNSAPVINNSYPPALTGLRGNHPGSFEVAHQLAREGRTDWGSIQEPDAAKREFLRLLTIETDQISDIPSAKKKAYISSISYHDFLHKHLSITQPEVFAVLQDLAIDPG